jgi:integrase
VATPKKLALSTSTYRGYVHKTERHILPALGTTRLRSLRPHDMETLYARMLNPCNGRRALTPKTVYEVHLIIRGALGEAVHRGLFSRNVALIANAPRLRSIPKVEQQAWTAEELQQFLRAAAGHRLFPALWLSAMTGMRRSELLGLRWADIDLDKSTVSINRALVAIGYELHESRGKTENSRRTIDLDPTTVALLRGWRALQNAGYNATRVTDPGRVFADADGTPSTRMPSPRRSNGSPGAPASPSSDSTTSATPTAPCSSRKASPSRSSANGSGTPTSPSPSRPTSTSFPACRPPPHLRSTRQPGVPPGASSTGMSRWNTRENKAQSQ